MSQTQTRTMKRTKANIKADWMTVFERAVIQLDPEHTGKIEWDTANHFYNLRLTTQDAANRYVENRK